MAADEGNPHAPVVPRRADRGRRWVIDAYPFGGAAALDHMAQAVETCTRTPQAALGGLSPRAAHERLAGLISTFGGGSGTAWYLLDTAQPIRPLILQWREELEFTALDRPGRAGTVEAERAAGWLEQRDLRDGALWGRIEWTARARALLAVREVRFVSPTPGVDPKSRRARKLIGGALVARPASRMTALASEEVSPATPPVTAPSPGLAARRVAMRGLGPDADDAAIVAAVAERLHLPAIAAEATAQRAATGTVTCAADPRLADPRPPPAPPGAVGEPMAAPLPRRRGSPQGRDRAPPALLGRGRPRIAQDRPAAGLNRSTTVPKRSASDPTVGAPTGCPSPPFIGM